MQDCVPRRRHRTHGICIGSWKNQVLHDQIKRQKPGPNSAHWGSSDEPIRDLGEGQCVHRDHHLMMRG